MGGIGVRDRGAAALAEVLDRLPRRQATLVVLTYHRVAPIDERPDLHPGLRVDPESFAAHLAIVGRHAQPVAADDLLAARAGARPLPARAVHVTLDDAYGCTERYAWPELRAAGVPATVFVPTAYPDSGRAFWWDRLHHALWGAGRPYVVAAGQRWPTGSRYDVAASFRSLRAAVVNAGHDEGMALVEEVCRSAGTGEAVADVVGWSALSRMGSEGLALAPHTRTHPRLPGLTADRLDDEVGGSWSDLRHRVPHAATPLFAPPGGATDPAVRTAARRAGLVVAMTTERGVNDGSRPRWDAIRRINVGPQATGGLVRLQLHPAPHRARVGALAVRDRVRALHPPRGGQTWN